MLCGGAGDSAPNTPFHKCESGPLGRAAESHGHEAKHDREAESRDRAAKARAVVTKSARGVELDEHEPETRRKGVASSRVVLRSATRRVVPCDDSVVVQINNHEEDPHRPECWHECWGAFWRSAWFACSMFFSIIAILFVWMASTGTARATVVFGTV